MSKPQISLLMTISTAHVPQNIAVAIDQMDADECDVSVDLALRDAILNHVCVEPVDQGYLFPVWSADYEYPSHPPELVTLLRFARQHGCDYLRLDADGPTVDGLPTWEW